MGVSQIGRQKVAAQASQIVVIDVFAQRVGVGMAKQPVVAVERGEHAPEQHRRGVAIGQPDRVQGQPFVPFSAFGWCHSAHFLGRQQVHEPRDPSAQGAYRALPCQGVVGVHDTAQEVHALRAALHDDFVGVQCQAQLLMQKLFNARLPLHQGLGVVGQQNEVVHVAHITAHLELVFDELVQLVEVDVGKKLAGQAANGHPNASRALKQGFVQGYFFEQRKVAAAYRGRVNGRLAQYRGGDLIKSLQGLCAVGQVGPCPLPKAQQNAPVDAGKAGLNVELDVPTAPRLAHKVLQPFHSGVGTFSLAVGVAVVNEAFVPPGFDMADEPLVYQTVSKSRRKDFTQFGVRYGKYRERLRLISALRDGASQAQNDVWQGHEVCELVFAVASIGRTGEELPGQVLDVCDVGCAQVRCFGLGG